MSEELCGHVIRQRGESKGEISLCARIKGHKGKHRDQAGIDADRKASQARFDALPPEQRSVMYREKNRRRADRQ